METRGDKYAFSSNEAFNQATLTQLLIFLLYNSYPFSCPIQHFFFLYKIL